MTIKDREMVIEMTATREEEAVATEVEEAIAETEEATREVAVKAEDSTTDRILPKSALTRPFRFRPTFSE